jgi:A/G-specific adenine glycosylase
VAAVGRRTDAGDVGDRGDVVAAASDGDVASELLAWFAAHARELPWRRGGRPRDPYRAWVAESMLQQTRVETVIPYYGRWLERFPDVASLAAAPLDAVLAAWQGLGYYRRARGLHAAAQIVAGAGWPHTVAGWRALPGVGPYMAAALASLCDGVDAAAVDGNALRVMARLCAEAGPVDQPAVHARLTRFAAGLLPPGRAGEWNEAVMDLGASICLPRRPRCGGCPVAAHCVARATGVAAALPRRTPRKPQPVEAVAMAVAIAPDGRICLQRRPDGGLLGGLWVFPDPSRLGLDARGGSALPPFMHVFTHRRWRVLGSVHAVAAAAPAAGDLRWARPDELPSMALAAPTVRLLQAAGLRGS